MEKYNPDAERKHAKRQREETSDNESLQMDNKAEQSKQTIEQDTKRKREEIKNSTIGGF